MSNKKEQFTLYVGTYKKDKVVTSDGTYTEILDGYWEVYNRATDETHIFNTFSELIDHLKDYKGNCDVRTQGLKQVGQFIFRELNKLGAVEVLSSKNFHKNGIEYVTYINDKETYSICININGHRITFKNMSTLFHGGIDTYSAFIEEEADFGNAYKIAEALKKIEEMTGVSPELTGARTAMNRFLEEFKYGFERRPVKFSSLYPKITLEEDKALRPAYRGGYCYIFKDNVEDVNVLDINSYYGYVACNYPLPCGKPIHFQNINYEEQLKNRNYYYILHIGVEDMKLKEGKIPATTYKDHRGMNYIRETEFIELTITDIEYDQLLEYYDFYSLEIYDMYGFTKGPTEFFKRYYDWAYTGKINATHKGNTAERTVYKLFCNALTGNFGKKPVGKLKKNGEYVESTQETVYLPVVIFITAICRVLLIKDMQKFYDIGALVYGDTDSIHYTGDVNLEELGITIGDDIGNYKYEGHSERAKYIHQRCYCMESNGVNTLKASGLTNRENIPFDKFYSGSTVTDTKIVCTEGKVYEVERPWTIGAKIA